MKVRWAGYSEVGEVAHDIALFIGGEAVYVALLAVAERIGPNHALMLLALALFFTFPFLPVYLATLTAVPERWTHRQRRAAAIAASPILLSFFVLLAVVGSAGLLVFSLPGTLAYGVLVRLPRRQDKALLPSRASPA
jgi:hypothetical protein